jgi:colanic acid/amylovoran biosynthesis glycosyltransferase
MPTLAYLTSRYPAVSHTFVLDEVRRMRAAGLDIQVASVNAPDRDTGGLTDEERAEVRTTFYVKRAGLLGALTAHLRTACTHPIAYLHGLGHAMTRGGLDPSRIVRSGFYFAEAVMIGQWMRRVDAQHLHVHFANPASTVASIARRIFPITFSMTVHGSPPFHDEPGLWFRKTVAEADFVCCISHFCRSQVMLRAPPRHWSRFEVTPMGVDMSRFQPPDREAQRRGHGPHEPLEILCVGRLAPVKGHDLLLAALRRLRLEGRNIRLHLVGDGPERARLEALAVTYGLEASVHFAGSINRDGIRRVYEQADVFALSSLTEGVPVVLMEALAMELPCVAPALAGIPELIRDGREGLLFRPGDEQALAQALARLDDDAALRTTLGQAGRARVLATHDLEDTAREIATVFRSRLALQSRPPDSGARVVASISEHAAPA